MVIAETVTTYLGRKGQRRYKLKSHSDLQNSPGRKLVEKVTELYTSYPFWKKKGRPKSPECSLGQWLDGNLMSEPGGGK